MDEPRLVGDYVLGRTIGSGSFAVVWRATHRSSESEVAVKEIDKKHLSPKVRDNLLKEISILSTIDHPNIIRFYEAIETSDKIYLVLEYCGGGDLAGYINRHGKVSESVARHFMRQLAAGLQVLQEKHLIHRDLKPQNLLLCTNDVTPLLKIGDFGFARSLTPQNLADTFCGSPLYMAPEIIQNQKYDAKADLWSAGAILFQLVTGKPPFDGNNHIQLFQNIVRGTELQFSEDALHEIHPLCIDLCRSLLRRNPIERLTFREFFNHEFLQVPRSSLLDAEHKFPNVKNVHQPLGETCMNERGSSSSASSSHTLMPIAGKCIAVIDSLELIEREYVLVNRHSASMEASSEFPDTSLQDCGRRNIGGDSSTSGEALRPIYSSESPLPAMSGPQRSTGTHAVTEAQRVHPTRRLKLLHQYAQTMTEVAREMSDAGQVRESLAVNLVVLAVWTRALETCDSWRISGDEDLPPIDSGTSVGLDLTSPTSAKAQVAQEFVVAYNQAENSSTQLKETSAAAAHMPDAMEIVYEKALTYGKNGGVEEYMNNKGSAGTLYSKAIALLSFIAEEAASLPLNPPFSLTPDDKNRILFYISNLQFRRSHL